jgi:hypothetical protein
MADDDHVFLKQVAALDHLAGKPVPDPKKPVALVSDGVQGWFATIEEAYAAAVDRFARETFAIRDLTAVVPFVPMIVVERSDV